ncbi:MAG TPA: glycosyltransferase [Methylomirabilota bacterium]|nr:glycosyltransferase [Methylomirabilota bacterium]
MKWKIRRKIKSWDLDIRIVPNNYHLKSKSWIPWYHGKGIALPYGKKSGFISSLDLYEDYPGSIFLPRSVNFDLFSNVQRKEKTDTIVIGHLWKRKPEGLENYIFKYFKNSDMFYEAVNLLSNKGVKVNVIDDFFPRKDMPKFYSSIDVFAEQFRIGSYGIPAIESLCCGIPVVGSYRSELLECKEAEEMIISAQQNPESIAASILEAYDSKIGSTKNVREFHSSKHAADIFEDCWKKLV